ncbi:MAG: hypothetical protein IPN01_35115 [Deltaproteobacteria bacterium]|nr:hypothetical protein [Deltaproteobacteria bacterium]
MLIEIEIDLKSAGRAYDKLTSLAVGALSPRSKLPALPADTRRLLEGAGSGAYDTLGSYDMELGVPASVQDGDVVELRYDAALLGSPDLVLVSDGTRVVACPAEGDVVPIYLTLAASDAGQTLAWGIISLKERDDGPCKLRVAAGALKLGVGRPTFFAATATNNTLGGLSEGISALAWRARCRLSVPLSFKERLRTFTPDNADDDTPPASAILTPTSTRWSSLLTAPTAAPKPTLLLIHGTGLQSTLGFAGLREKLPAGETQSLLRRLYDEYEGRVLALDHKTISKPVVKNLQLLAEAFPSGDGVLSLDVLAVSRGGLVARGLVEGLADEVLTAGGARLSARVKVRRVVLVATPNNGTPMGTNASALACLDRVRCEREDGQSGVGFTPDLQLLGSWGQEIFEGLFPGAKEMTPSSELLARLNGYSGAGTTLSAFGSLTGPVYHAVAAKFRATAIGYRGCVEGVFNDRDNDLVVPTLPCVNPTVNNGSVAKGLFTLPAGRKHTFDEGAAVTHSDYFYRARTHRLLKAWLIDGVELSLPT